MRPLLLGEMPSVAEGPDAWRRPLSGRVGTTLCKLAGLETYEDLDELFVLKNVVVKPRRLSDVWWSTLDARTRLEQLRELHGGPCVCLGRRVSVAAGIQNRDWGEWVHQGDRSVVAIPHPSGLNRLYNQQDMRAVASRTLSEALACHR